MTHRICLSWLLTTVIAFAQGAPETKFLHSHLARPGWFKVRGITAANDGELLDHEDVVKRINRLFEQ